MKRYLLLLILIFSLYFSLACWPSGYVGSEVCFKCHPEEYNDFKVSGHSYKLQRSEIVRTWPIPLPKGYTWDDISYVIGGFYKKIRYIDNNGFIITAAKDGSELKTQYNLENDSWSFYNKGEKMPYNCGYCHTTGYHKEGNQDGREGLIGTWAAPGVQCEACHGPGSAHVVNGDKSKIQVNRSSELCGLCHIRGAKDKIPAKDGFIEHHEGFNELLASPHADIDCVECHNPHKRADFGIKKDCAACHDKEDAAYKGSVMELIGVKCIDCHMPRATKSAIQKGEFAADMRTHLFTINTDADMSMFYTEEQDGKISTFARGFVTLDFACLNCHKNKDKAWAAAKAKNIHSYGKTEK